MLTLLTLLSTLVAVSVSAASLDPAANSTDRSPRVRPSDGRTASLLLQGLHRSSTIRSLVTALEARDVIVYIEMQPALKQRLAGTLSWVTSTKAHRYVRIAINPELSTDVAVATLGHELQHALEIANARQIVNARAMAAFYQSHGDANQSQSNGWDTEAARVAGHAVRRELSETRTTRLADSAQEFDPANWLVMYRRAQGILPP
jgi:hypothetical protein